MVGNFARTRTLGEERAPAPEVALVGGGVVERGHAAACRMESQDKTGWSLRTRQDGAVTKSLSHCSEDLYSFLVWNVRVGAYMFR